ncbi:MAG: hypothetical protein WC866_04785 [Patescibacteria group bacterium]|jgi:hypothetical protein
MTNQAALSPAERDALRPIADTWMREYIFALGEASFNPNTTLEQWIDVAWEKGLLDHVSPTDPAVREARARMGRTLWRERQDPVLYWRLQYALENFRVSAQHTRTSGPAAQACVELSKELGKNRTKLEEYFPKLKYHSSWPWYLELSKLLMARAQKTLRGMGVTPHEPTLRRHSTGVFRGIPVEIETVCDDGTLWLQATEWGEGNANVIALLDLMTGDYQLNDGRGICPSLIDATVFTPYKDKDR